MGGCGNFPVVRWRLVTLLLMLSALSWTKSGYSSTVVGVTDLYEHTYPEKIVLLYVWIVKDFHGEAHGREGQAVR